MAVKYLTAEEIAALGVKFDVRLMDNGEYRTRVCNPDGSSYILTMMPDDVPGAWQKSHSHKGVVETYSVQKGWIGYVEQIEGFPKLSICEAGEEFTTHTGVAHNVFMSSGSVIHTVKRGDFSAIHQNHTMKGEDRWPSPELDSYCGMVTLEQLEELIRANHGICS